MLGAVIMWGGTKGESFWWQLFGKVHRQRPSGTTAAFGER